MSRFSAPCSSPASLIPSMHSQTPRSAVRTRTSFTDSFWWVFICLGHDTICHCVPKTHGLQFSKWHYTQFFISTELLLQGCHRRLASPAGPWCGQAHTWAQTTPWPGAAGALPSQGSFLMWARGSRLAVDRTAQSENIPLSHSLTFCPQTTVSVSDLAQLTHCFRPRASLSV